MLSDPVILRELCTPPGRNLFIDRQWTLGTHTHTHSSRPARVSWQISLMRATICRISSFLLIHSKVDFLNHLTTLLNGIHLVTYPLNWIRQKSNRDSISKFIQFNWHSITWRRKQFVISLLCRNISDVKGIPVRSRCHCVGSVSRPVNFISLSAKWRKGGIKFQFHGARAEGGGSCTCANNGRLTDKGKSGENTDNYPCFNFELREIGGRRWRMMQRWHTGSMDFRRVPLVCRWGPASRNKMTWSD